MLEAVILTNPMARMVEMEVSPASQLLQLPRIRMNANEVDRAETTIKQPHKVTKILVREVDPEAMEAEQQIPPNAANRISPHKALSQAEMAAIEQDREDSKKMSGVAVQ